MILFDAMTVNGDTMTCPLIVNGETIITAHHFYHRAFFLTNVKSAYY